MVTGPSAGQPKRVTYKAYLSLFPKEWEELREEAAKRGVTGGELISSLLSRYIWRSRAPLPEDQGEEDQEP